MKNKEILLCSLVLTVILASSVVLIGLNNNFIKTNELNFKLSATSTPPATGDWVISSGGIYVDVSYLVNGSVIISASTPVSFYNSSLTMTGSFEVQSSNNYFKNNTITTNVTANPTITVTNVNNDSFIANKIISPAESVSITNANQSIFKQNTITGKIGVYCTSAYSDNITGNNILATDGGGVVLKSSNFNLVTNNTIKNSLVSHSTIEGSAVWFQNAQNNTISNNTLTDTSSDGVSSYGDFSTHNNNISNNIITANGYGFALRGENNTIGYNNISATSDGVFFYCLTGINNCNTVKSGRNTIIGNNINITASGSDGIYIDTIVIPNKVINNTIFSLNNGIYVHSSNYELIKGNTINTTNYGLDIEQSSFLNVSRNNITSTANGIYLLQSNNNTFYNNFVNSATNSSNAALFMVLYYTGSTYVDDLYNSFYYNNFTSTSSGVVTDFSTGTNAPNYFIGNYIHGTGAGEFGIEAIGVNMTFTNNTIIGASEGMDLVFGPFFTINNTIIGETSYGIYASGNAGSQIINNTIYSPKTPAIYGGSGTITGNVIHLIDITPPTLVSGTATNQILEYKSATVLSWTANDLAPDSYSIYLNQTLLTSGSWQNAVAVQFNTNNIAVGFYNFSIVFNDTSNNILTITFNLTIIDSTAPVFSSEPNSNTSLTVGFQALQLTWIFMDYSNYTYTVYLDGTVNETGYGYGSQTTVTIPVSGLSQGTYNYTIVVKDIYGNQQTSTALLTVSKANQPTTPVTTTTSTSTSSKTNSANSSGSPNTTSSSNVSGYTMVMLLLTFTTIPLIRKYRK